MGSWGERGRRSALPRFARVEIITCLRITLASRSESCSRVKIFSRELGGLPEGAKKRNCTFSCEKSGDPPREGEAPWAPPSWEPPGGAAAAWAGPRFGMPTPGWFVYDDSPTGNLLTA